MTSEQIAIRTSYFSIITNTGLAIIKGIAGFLGNSYALIADAIESTADIFSSGLVLFGLKYSSRPADKNHPYGHGRIEPLITFSVVGFLIAAAILISYEAIQNIGTSHKLPEGWTLYILGAIILWKETSYRLVMKRAKITGSSSLKTDAWHHRSDAITSVAAFIGISIALSFGKGYESADDWAALFASGFILYNSYLIFRPALGEIMDEQQYDDLVTDIKKQALKVDGVLDTEKCYVRKLGMYFNVDLHIIVDKDISVEAGHAISHRLKDFLIGQNPNISNVFIHVEPNTLIHTAVTKESC